MIMSGSSSSPTVNPPTPGLSSLASTSTPPSSEFIYLNGNMTNTTPPMTTTSLDHMQLSLASVGQSITLEEALMRVADLMRENSELKVVLQQNNFAMKEQCQVLSSVKDQWAAEREEMKYKFDQTRTVIMELRRTVEDKEAKLIDLEGQLVQRSDELIVTKEESPSLSAQMNSLRQRREEAEKQAELHSAQNKFLQKQTEKLNDKIAELIEAKSNLDGERVRMMEDNDKLRQECAELKKLTVKQQETQERLVQEKQELLRLNDDLQYQVQELTAKSELLAEQTSDELLNHRELLGLPAAASPTARPADTGEGGEEAVAGPSGIGEEGVNAPTAYNRERLAGLSSELEEERKKITRLQVRLSEQNTLVQTLQQQIHGKDRLLAAGREELTVTVDRLNKRHERQIEDLKSQLKLQPNYNEDVLTLRAQVTSLVNELQESEQRLKDANDDIERYKQSCSELQARIILQEAEVSRQRSREDKLTADLRAKIANIEATLSQEKEDKKSKEVSLQELRLNFDQLCNDYHELLSKHEDYKEKQTSRPGAGELSNTQQMHFQEQIDNLTAQIITAEEALVHKDNEIDELKEELRKAKEDVIPLLKAQAEVYMGDFKAEREAREQAHSEKLRLMEEMEKQKHELEDLYEQNFMLETQIREYSDKEFDKFAARHRIEEGTEEEATGGTDTGGNLQDPEVPGRTEPDPHHVGETDEPERLVCPICETTCPDQHSLRLHVTECLDTIQG